MTPMLEAPGVSVSFGGVRALVDVDLKVGRGQLLVILVLPAPFGPIRPSN